MYLLTPACGDINIMIPTFRLSMLGPCILNDKLAQENVLLNTAPKAPATQEFASFLSSIAVNNFAFTLKDRRICVSEYILYAVMHAIYKGDATALEEELGRMAHSQKVLLLGQGWAKGWTVVMHAAVTGELDVFNTILTTMETILTDEQVRWSCFRAKCSLIGAAKLTR